MSILSNLLKSLDFRQSTTDPNKHINSRGDSVKQYSSGHVNINGSHKYTSQSAANTLNNLGKKK